MRERERDGNRCMMWLLIWLNRSVVTINIILQLLDIYRLGKLMPLIYIVNHTSFNITVNTNCFELLYSNMFFRGVA